KLLNEFNATSVKYQEQTTVINLFEDQVSKTPDKIALVDGEEVLSYKEVNDQSNKLAYYLQDEYGIKKGDFVGVMLPRCSWSVVSILGIMKAGGVYVPIDVKYPDTRKEYILKDTQIKVLLISSESILEVTGYDVPVVSVDIELEGLPDELRPEGRYNGFGSDLAYVIYTSGS